VHQGGNHPRRFRSLWYSYCMCGYWMHTKAGTIWKRSARTLSFPFATKSESILDLITLPPLDRKGKHFVKVKEAGTWRHSLIAIELHEPCSTLRNNQRASQQVPVDSTSNFPVVALNERSAHFSSDSKPPAMDGRE